MSSEDTTMTQPFARPVDLAAAIAAHQAEQAQRPPTVVAQALNDALQPTVDRLRAERHQPPQAR